MSRARGGEGGVVVVVEWECAGQLGLSKLRVEGGCSIPWNIKAGLNPKLLSPPIAVRGLPLPHGQVKQRGDSGVGEGGVEGVVSVGLSSGSGGILLQGSYEDCLKPLLLIRLLSVMS